MKVVLLYPEVYDMARFREGRKEFPPFGVLSLGAILLQAGHEVCVEKVTRERPVLDLWSFDAIGFSLASSATYGMMLDARNSAKLRPDALVMVGGVHCNFFPEQSIREFDAGIACDGEGEESIIDILEHAKDRNFDGIPGILYRRDGEIVRTKPRPLLPSIDALPFSARELLPMADVIMSDRLAGTDTLMAHVMFSRGCPFPCTFCAVAQTRMQYRGGGSARAELQHLVDTYHIDGFAIADDNFIVNKRKVGEIAREIAPLGLRWSALSRVDTVDGDLLKTMASSGCIEIKFGVESGSERLLKAMRKNTTHDRIRSAIGLTHAAGVRPKAFIVHGFPGENDATTDETMSLLNELRRKLARVSLFRFVPLPGTAVYSDAAGYGIRGTHLAPDWDGDWSKFHIHHNNRHWWGTEADWEVTERSYQRLRAFVESEWGPQG